MTDAPRDEGWHPDPYGRFRSRWWDGSEWTAYARDTEVAWDPEPIDAARPVEPGLPGVVTAFVGYAAAVAVAALVSATLIGLDRPGGRTTQLVLSQLGLWSGLIGAVVVVSRRRGTRSVVQDFVFRFRWIDVGFGLAGAIAGRLVSIAFVAPIPRPSHRIDEVDRSVLGSNITGWGWLVVIGIVCVGAPLVEELFFRGLVQTRLVERLGPASGIAIASVLFGAAHLTAWNGPETFLYAWAVAGGGLVLGLLRYLTGRLGPAVVAHALFNAQAVALIALLN